MRKDLFVTTKIRSVLLASALMAFAGPVHAEKEVVTVGIGIQNTTTNTVTGGIVIDKLGLLDKYVPKTGKYANVEFKLDWQNFTSGPPITNGMIADRIQIGMMGDYPLLVNGATFQAGHATRSKLIAIIAYNQYGAGNGLVVHKDSPYYELSDLKGKKVSVPFMELLPYRGYARKIFDGVETKLPTFHGIIVRQDFADKYPEFVVAYLKALIDANDWVRKNPKLAAEKIEEWTKIEKEVVYMFLGPGGIHTLDPTIKPKWVETIKYDAGVLQRLGRVKEFNADAWVDESWIRRAYKEKGLDYDKQSRSRLAKSGSRMATSASTARPPVCSVP